MTSASCSPSARSARPARKVTDRWASAARAPARWAISSAFARSRATTWTVTSASAKTATESQTARANEPLPTIRRSAPATRSRRRVVAEIDDPVAIVDVHHVRLTAAGVVLAEDRVAQHDHQVAGVDQPGGGAVDA